MKQHITVEQLNELSNKGKEKLFAYWETKRHTDKAPLVTQGIEHYITGKGVRHYLPLLSIGQMIEFLDGLDLEVVVSKPHLTEYIVSVYDKYTDKVSLDVNSGFYQSLELCDALWEAVKEVLEKHL